jgi:Kef-type K+ transport system membrane component KefB
LSRFGLPKIVAYLITGVIVGLDVLDLVSAATVADLGLVNGVAVCLIALTAGCELNFARFRPLFGVIRSLTIFAVLGSVVALTLLLFAMTPMLDFLAPWPLPARIAICAMLGITLSAQSPAVVMALLSETRADGPLARTMLGTVVVADLVVIVLFGVASAIGQATMGGPVDAGGTVAAIAWELFGSIAVGAIVGGLLALALRLLPRGLALFVLLVCVVVAEVGRRVHLDPLIVMLSAGLVVGNATENGASVLLHEIERASLPVYLLFFAVAGASMHIELLAVLWLPAAILVAGRAASFWLGARIATARTDAAPAVRRWAFAGLLPQAGLALALALLVGRALGETGEAASALVLSVIAINELVMPIVVRRALESAGETSAEPHAASPH